jgi:hypothetical protein
MSIFSKVKSVYDFFDDMPPTHPRSPMPMPLPNNKNNVVRKIVDSTLDALDRKIEDNNDSKYERPSSSIHKAHRGDVIGIRRNGIIDYKHFAIYAGNDSVIHYAHDSSGKITIHKASMAEFLDDNNSKTYFVCNFPKKHGRPKEIDVPSSIIGYPKFQDIIKENNYHLYSPNETIERAESRLGENAYDLLTNNCEYFALWCKTGVAESHQVEDLFEIINPSKDIFLT